MDPLHHLSFKDYALVIQGKKDLTKHDPEATFEAVCSKIAQLWGFFLAGELLYVNIYPPQNRQPTLKEGVMLLVTLFYPHIVVGGMYFYDSNFMDTKAYKELREIGRHITARQNEPSAPERAFQGIADYWGSKTTFQAKVYQLFYRALALESASGSTITEMPTFSFSRDRAYIRLSGKKLTLIQTDDISEKINGFLLGYPR